MKFFKENRGVVNWAGDFFSKALFGMECLDHSDKNCLGVKLKKQVVAEQEKESKSGTSKYNAIMIPWGQVRTCEPSLRLWKGGDLFYLTLRYTETLKKASPRLSWVKHKFYSHTPSSNHCPGDTYAITLKTVIATFPQLLSSHSHS